MKTLSYFLAGFLLTAPGICRPVQAATITVNSLADGAPANDGNCTLREAIIAANSNTAANGCSAGEAASRDIIDLPINGTITLTSTLPDIPRARKLEGLGLGCSPFRGLTTKLS